MTHIKIYKHLNEKEMNHKIEEDEKMKPQNKIVSIQCLQNLIS